MNPQVHNYQMTFNHDPHSKGGGFYMILVPLDIFSDAHNGCKLL
jgi:hypothetical protein